MPKLNELQVGQPVPGRAYTPTNVSLFLYNAAIWNAHRIHYDAPYARDVERYRGLVVHGPLMATLLLDLAAQKYGDNALDRFAFRENPELTWTFAADART